MDTRAVVIVVVCVGPQNPPYFCHGSGGWVDGFSLLDGNTEKE